jgi:hypothetical protein
MSGSPHNFLRSVSSFSMVSMPSASSCRTSCATIARTFAEDLAYRERIPGGDFDVRAGLAQPHRMGVLPSLTDL